MSTELDRLYQLLPGAFRVRDAAEGRVLEALLAVIEEAARALEDDIERLLDDWFVETCAEWVVPYIGDLVGARDILPTAPGSFSRRSLVANTIAYRRRKGTAAVLEQLARDVSGWPASAVEMFQRLATTQSLDHVRLQSLATADVRQRSRPELAGTAFETATHTLDVRHVDIGRGRYNLPDVALFLWRLQAYPVERSTARPAPDQPRGNFTFSPVGIDGPLFNHARTEVGVSSVTAEADVPGPLRRRVLFDERAQRLTSVQPPGGSDEGYFGDEPVVAVFVDGARVPLAKMAVCHLGTWRPPPKGADVAVDPVLGRLTTSVGKSTDQVVEVSYAYGFAGDLGGGPYDRQASLASALTRPVDWQVAVGEGGTVGTLEDAVIQWNALPEGRVGVIAITDNRSHPAPSTAIEVKEGSQLVVVAAGWPQDAGGGRSPGRLHSVGRRPHVRGDIVVHGASALGSLAPGAMVVDGVLLEGAITVVAGNLGSLRVAHSTVVPTAGRAGIRVTRNGIADVNAGLRVTLERTICGAIALSTDMRLTVVDSVVDATDVAAGAIDAGTTELRDTTVFGTVAVRTLEASNCIFTGTVHAERRQLGCARYCYLPVGSLVARRFRCQPVPPVTPESAARVAPIFVSTSYGQPGYAQLAATCPPEVAAGGADESQMGAFAFLFEPQRLKNLRGALQDYLRVGLEAGVFFVT